MRWAEAAFAGGRPDARKLSDCSGPVCSSSPARSHLPQGPAQITKNKIRRIANKKNPFASQLKAHSESGPPFEPFNETLVLQAETAERGDDWQPIGRPSSSVNHTGRAQVEHSFPSLTTKTNLVQDALRSDTDLQASKHELLERLVAFLAEPNRPITLRP